MHVEEICMFFFYLSLGSPLFLFDSRIIVCLEIGYDTVSDLVVKPFPRRSEIQYQYIWVIRVGDDCHDGPE